MTGAEGNIDAAVTVLVIAQEPKGDGGGECEDQAISVEE